MPKIKIKDKGFPSTHYGYCEANAEMDVSDGFAAYCVKRMKSAEYAVPPKPKRSTTKKGKRQ